MKSEIIYRSAIIEDLQTLYKFEQGIIEYERPYDPTLKNGHINYYDIKEMIQSENTEVVVAKTKKRIIASAYVQKRKALPYLNHEYYGYLGFMFVIPEYRGLGINKEIIEFLKSWARSKDLSEIRLDVYNNNQSAISAYSKSGFSKHLVNMRMEI